MKKLLSFFINRHQDILRVILLLAAIALITYMFPKTGKFKYGWELGKPWEHEDLIAEFDFAIKKSEAQLNEERALIAAEVPPHYRLDNRVLESQLLSFEGQLTKKINQLERDSIATIDSLLYYNFGAQLLNEVYGKGVIELSEKHKENKVEEIVVLDKNMATETSVGQLRKLEEATNYITRQVRDNNQYMDEVFVPYLVDVATYNITFDDSLTQLLLEDRYKAISPTQGKIDKGQIIIAKGQKVNADNLLVLESYRENYEDQFIGGREQNMMTVGYGIMTALLLVLFMLYILNYHRELFRSLRKQIFMLALMIGMMMLVKLAVQQNLTGLLYAVPFCIVPIILRTFFGIGVAFFAHLVVIIVTAFIVPMEFGFFFLQFAAGLVSIFANRTAKYWSQFFSSIGLILLTYVLGYVAITIIPQGLISDIEPMTFAWLTVNVFLTLLAYPLIPVFEKLFGFVSDITLVELADLNKPLLKKLSVEAPGTFQHSLQVANLAEAAAYEIGANSQLVRTGALYHDIGKMKNPLYFTENQSGHNPHDELPYQESAQIIIAHVTDGIAMAKKARLPDILIDFIRTHHGTTRVEYFYINYKKDRPGQEIDDSPFRYPGPVPYSKETAVLMMADTVEAATRSLKNPTKDRIEELVDKLIDHQVSMNQFMNSNITFKDITTCRKIFKKMLNSIYHTRVEYPE